MDLVLLLEDEPLLRSSMARALRKLEGVEVLEAATFRDALAVLASHAPLLVLSDINLPDRSGLEIISELQARRMNPPVVFISAFVDQFGDRIPRGPNIEVLNKPVGVEALRSLVRRKLDERTPIEPFSVVDLLYLARMGRHSVEIETMGSESTGIIRIFKGEIWYAEDDAGTGREALRRLCEAHSDRLTCRTLRDDPGARNVDAQTGDIASRPAWFGAGKQETAPAESEPVWASNFDSAYEEGVNALLERDYDRSLRAFRAADSIRQGDGRVQANLARLRDLVDCPKGDHPMDSSADRLKKNT